MRTCNQYMTGLVFTSQKIFSEHDRDNSGTMDMFEMRKALSKQGNVSWIFADPFMCGLDFTTNLSCCLLCSAS